MLLIFFLIYFITMIIITTYSVACTTCQAFSPLFQCDEVGATIIPISKMRKLRCRDVERLSERLKLNNLMKFIQIVRERSKIKISI